MSPSTIFVKPDGSYNIFGRIFPIIFIASFITMLWMLITLIGEGLVYLDNYQEPSKEITINLIIIHK